METPAGLRIGRSRPFGDRAPVLVGGSPTIGDLERVPPNDRNIASFSSPTTTPCPCSLNTILYTLTSKSQPVGISYFHLFHETMSSTPDANIDPTLRASDSPTTTPRPKTSPVVLPDGTLVSKSCFETQLYVLRPHLFTSVNSDAFADRRSKTKPR